MRKSLFVACVAFAMLVPSTYVAAQSANDKAMAQVIGSRLKESGQLRDYRIGVKYQDGVTWLSGTVSSQQQLAAAMRLTQGIQGVDHVVNNLTITNSAASDQSGRSLDLGGSLQQASRQSAQSPRPMVNAAAARPAVNQAYLANGQPAARQVPQQRRNMPLPMRPMPVRQASGKSIGPAEAQYVNNGMAGGYPMAAAGSMGGAPIPTGYVPGGDRAVSYDSAHMPGYAWPSYSAYPNYAALSYPQQYSPSAWPYIGPFYPYPQVPLGWRKVCLEWDDGWWFLDFSDCGSNH